jgi:hypothetical protein
MKRMELVFFDDIRGQQLLNALHNQKTFIRKQMHAIASKKEYQGDECYCMYQTDIESLTAMRHMIKEICLQYKHLTL